MRLRVVRRLGEGAHAGGGSIAAIPVRRVNDGGANFLSYSLFSDAQRTAADRSRGESSSARACTSVAPSDSVTIELDGVASSTTMRAMTSGAHQLHYLLYLDAARTLIWGTGAGGTATYGPVHPTDGASTSVPIFGRVPARQDVPVGSYADAVIVTVLF